MSQKDVLLWTLSLNHNSIAAFLYGYISRAKINRLHERGLRIIYSDKTS